MSSDRDDRDIFTLGGTVQAGHGIYIRRAVDEQLTDLCRAGTFAYILTARQMGKSSLMVATAEHLAAEGIRSATIDLTRIGAGKEVTIEQWYLGLLIFIRKRLELESDVISFWSARKDVTYIQRLMDFFEEVVLTEIQSRVVIFIDEIDTTLRLQFTDDFFAAIRHLFNERSRVPALHRLSFVLIGVATPSDLIRNPEQTPFNIGQRVELTDFTESEASSLLPGMNVAPEQQQNVLRWMMDWTGGHPYLTQRVCRMIALESKAEWSRDDVDKIVERAFFTDMKEGDHNLQFVRDMLLERSREIGSIEPAEVLATYDRVRCGNNVLDEERSVVIAHLKLAGIVSGHHGTLRVRNRVYARVFDHRWVRQHLPPTWIAQQLRRTRTIAAGVAAALIAVTVFAFVIHGMNRDLSRAKTGLAVQNTQLATKSVRLQETIRELDTTIVALNTTERSLRQRNDDLKSALDIQKSLATVASRAERETRDRADLDLRYRNAAAALLKDANPAAVTAFNEIRPDYERRGDIAGVALTAMSVAEARYKAARDMRENAREWRETVDAYKDAARQYARAGDRKTEAYAHLQAGGFTERMLQAPDEAVEPFLRASKLYAALGEEDLAVGTTERSAQALVRGYANGASIEAKLADEVLASLDDAIVVRKRTSDNGASEMIALDYWVKGTIHSRRDDKTNAAQALSAARDVYAFMNALEDEIQVLVARMRVFVRLAAPEEAQQVFETTTSELVGRLAKSTTATDRGTLHSGLGQLYEAMDKPECVQHYQNALKEYGAAGNAEGRMKTHAHLAKFYRDRDETAALTASIDQYVASLEQTGPLDEDDQRELTATLRTAYRGDVERRDAYFNRSISELHDAGKHADEAFMRCKWGLLAGVSNNPKAATTFQAALDNCRRDDCPASVEGQIAMIIGEFYLRAEQPRRAAPYFEEAAAAYRRHRDVASEAAVTERAADLYRRQLDESSAASTYARAADLYRYAGRSEDDARATFESARSLTKLDDKESALDAFNRALTLYRQKNDLEKQRAVLKELVAAHQKWGNDEAAASAQEAEEALVAPNS